MRSCSAGEAARRREDTRNVCIICRTNGNVTRQSCHDFALIIGTRRAYIKTLSAHNASLMRNYFIILHIYFPYARLPSLRA